MEFTLFLFFLWMIIDQNIEMSVTVFFVLKCIAHQISEARRASVQRSHLAVVTNPLGQRQNLGTTCREHVTGLSMPPCSEMPYSERFSSSVALSSRSLPHLKTPDTSHPPCFPLPSRPFPDSHQPHFGFGSIWIVTLAPVRLVMRNQDGALMETLHACGKIQEATRKIQVSCSSVMHF